MSSFDFDEIEEELDLVVPEVYRMFIEAVEWNRFDLAKNGIYHNSKILIEGNWQARLHLGDADPKWKDHYLDFGVGDGCGNYFFLIATAEDDDTVQLWSHDPPGIEDVSTGTEFFKNLVHALATNFRGVAKHLYQGTAGRWC